ncbi:MAG TPA: hypothetical protein DCX17_00900 [Firmicutes bacterium]|nr:hypothetical protein [Bacillota bacterium]
MNNSLNRPKFFTWLIKPVSSRCNLNCDYCFYLDAARLRSATFPHMMNEDTTDHLIEMAIDSATDTISFVFQGGEPLLAGLPFYHTFIEKAQKANQKNINIVYSLQTNGLMLNEEWVNFFKDNNWLLGISVDGEEKANKWRSPNNFSKDTSLIIKNIELLRNNNVPFDLLAVVHKKNFKMIVQSYDFLKTLGAKSLQFIPCLDFIKKDNELALDSNSWRESLLNLYRRWRDDWKKGIYISIRQFDDYIAVINSSPLSSCAARGICGGYLMVESDGGVFTCDFYGTDDFLIGNIADGFFELFNNSKLIKFINESFILNEKCLHCQYRFLCRGGCKKYRNGDQHFIYCDATKTLLDYAYSGLREIALSIRYIGD